MHEFAELRGREAAFAETEFAERQSRARAAIRAAGHEALVVTGPENIYWLTGRQTAGYFAFQALVLPVEGNPASSCGNWNWSDRSSTHGCWISAPTRTAKIRPRHWQDF
ncbi:aminopeptidase P family N-terminal domain-containing protein [Rhizobium sp. RCAM05973]|uniref:aminopeptidase P family N-terminal domain-containing protein n=1 Tax=Rhizobium sp. RCAM05973 TaxID=2994066 RepID=UPI0032B7E90F